MKIISKEDLLIIIPMINDRVSFDINDFKTILERFGDDYFIEDGRFTKTSESEEMRQIRQLHKGETEC